MLDRLYGLLASYSDEIIIPHLDLKSNLFKKGLGGNMCQEIKAEIKNNIIVSMAGYLNTELTEVLEKVIIDEFVRVNMEEISTLPSIHRDQTTEQNKYAIELFLHQKRNLKKETKENYLNAVKRLIVLLDKSLIAIDDTDIIYYLNWYEKHNMFSGGKRNQGSTINNERRYLSAFFTWMRKARLIQDNPVEATDPLKVLRKPIDYFHPEDLAKMKDNCKNSRERALVEVLRSTGARVGELVEITLDQIDWHTGDIMILGEKSDKYRAIYLDEDARYYYKLYLESRKDSSPYMFPQSRAPHGQMSTCGIRSVMKTIGNRAGVTCRVYPHKMRKTLGMSLKNKGVDIGTIQEIMGHASPAVTAQYYAQSTPQTLRYVRERAAA